MAALLASAAHEEGQTVICATHDPAVIGQADYVVVLDGRGLHAGSLTLERLS